MPWKSVSIMEERIRFVARYHQGETNLSRLCRDFGISRPTGYLWLKRYEEVGNFHQLQERSRRPHCIWGRTPEAVEGQVVKLRQRYGWGALKVRHLLCNDGINLPVVTINRILKRHNLIKPEARHQPAVKRFERAKPNELWQMDFKGDYRLSRGCCYPLSILDDCSRFGLGLYALPNHGGDGVYASLIRTFERYGVPDAMLMDHGTPWWSSTNPQGMTWLTVALIKQGIKLYFSGPRHPQTQGKVERFHRTLEDALNHRGRPETLATIQEFLQDFLVEYNQVRPHEALSMAVPAQRYQVSSKNFNPKPPEWQYPIGAIVRRLNPQGCLDYRHLRLFACEALAGEWIQIEPVADKILVRYRHMYIREISLNTGRSASLLKPALLT